MKKFILFIFRLTIFFEICWGAHAWFTWWTNSSALNSYLTLFILAIISLIYSKTNHVKLNQSKYILLAFFYYLLGYLFSSHFAIFGVARSALALIPIWVLVSDKSENANGHLSFVVRILSVILVFGLIEYFVFNLYPFPSIIMQYGENDNYVFLNYGFYLRNIGEYSFLTGSDVGFQRFASVFLEPGYLSAMLVFLLYALQFDFSKRENRILLYAIILSLSLAGYVMFVIGYFFHRLLRRKSMLALLSIPLIMVIVYLVAINYNGGDNYLNSEIVERLMPDENYGISGNNRTSDMTRDYFYRGLVNGDSYWGLGAERVERINGGKLNGFDHNAINGTGAIYYFVVNGILAALLYLLFYVMIARDSRTAPYSTYFVILIMVCFIQASYPDSASWIYPFVLGLKNFKNDCKKESAHRRNIVVVNA